MQTSSVIHRNAWFARKIDWLAARLSKKNTQKVVQYVSETLFTIFRDMEESLGTVLLW